MLKFHFWIYDLFDYHFGVRVDVVLCSVKWVFSLSAFCEVGMFSLSLSFSLISLSLDLC